MTAPNTDAVERLVARLNATLDWYDDEGVHQLINPDGPEAAATITAQAARIAELEQQVAKLVRHLKRAVELRP